MLNSLSKRLCILVGLLAATAQAQTRSVPLPSRADPAFIRVSFIGLDLQQIDGVGIPADGTLPTPSIYFKEGGRRIYLLCDASLTAMADGTPVKNQIDLKNFRTLDGTHQVHLVRGSDDNGMTVPAVAAGGKRTYLITWESIRLETQSQAAPVLTTVKVGAATDNVPTLSAIACPEGRPDCRGEREFIVGAFGLSAAKLLAKFKHEPSKIRVVYKFDVDDPAQNFNHTAVALRGLPDDNAPHSVVVDIGRALPHRPETYSVTLEFPAEDLRGTEEDGFTVPPKEPAKNLVLKASQEITLAPPSDERAKTEFFFEGTFTSVVSAKDRSRSNVGLFGLRYKPTLGLRMYNTEDASKAPWWVAFRPLLNADVDTQHIEDSEAPNRTVFGLDFEYGRGAKLRPADAAPARVQQFVWLNGLRYDSDRDFKLQTAYWHTELVPTFWNAEQTAAYRLWQFRHPCARQTTPSETCSALEASREHQFPLISSYHFRPSVGYQLGGIVNRDRRITGFPTDNISRLFVKFSTAIEFRQLIQLSLDDTYYFLENAPRRRNRNYLEAHFDFNTGAFFNVNLGALQSALTLKFQRGDLPPRFKPVNALSIGIKLFR